MHNFHEINRKKEKEKEEEWKAKNDFVHFYSTLKYEECTTPINNRPKTTLQSWTKTFFYPYRGFYDLFTTASDIKRYFIVTINSGVKLGCNEVHKIPTVKWSFGTTKDYLFCS
jgi:hypothetical protein